MADSAKPISLLLPIRTSAVAQTKGKLALPRVQSDSRRGRRTGRPLPRSRQGRGDLRTRRTGRGETQETTIGLDADQLLALEAADGTTLFIRADKLQEDLQRVYPAAVRNGTLDLSVLRDRQAAYEDWPTGSGRRPRFCPWAKTRSSMPLRNKRSSGSGSGWGKGPRNWRPPAFLGWGPRP